MTLFTDFERDSNAKIGVMWNDFVTAVGMYVYTNEPAGEVFVSDIAMCFNTTLTIAREAVDEHHWLHRNPDDSVQSDGE